MPLREKKIPGTWETEGVFSLGIPKHREDDYIEIVLV